MPPEDSAALLDDSTTPSEDSMTLLDDSTTPPDDSMMLLEDSGTMTLLLTGVPSASLEAASTGDNLFSSPEQAAMPKSMEHAATPRNFLTNIPVLT